MRDISRKINTLRVATATAVLTISPETINLIKENKIPKGNPFEVSKVAAIQAAKNTSQIIPYCHPLPVEHVEVNFNFVNSTIEITILVKAIYKTGVEMEALTAASVAALTIYDMLKMLDEKMEIKEVKLLNKKGGKSDYKTFFKEPLKAAVLVMSDSIASGEKDDESGQLIVKRLKSENIEVVDYKIIPDDIDKIKNEIIKYSDDLNLDMVFTTGGTGFSPRDNTPEAMNEIIEKDAPGISEAMRSFGQLRTPYSMLSRGKAGIRGKTIIINLPGSKKGVEDSLDAIFPFILHSLKTMQGYGHDIQKERIKK